MERWAYRTQFENLKTLDSSLEVGVTMDGVSLGTLTLVFDYSDMANVKIVATVTDDPACPDEYVAYVKQLKEVSQNPRWIKVWYESGHTLTDGAIFEVRHRDQPFGEFHWGDFKNYEIKTEKFWGKGPLPDNVLDLIGTQKSLFCWVRNNWPLPGGPYSRTAGWLACDDGTMEIADFIHLDVGGKEPVLTQIHVKGSHSDSATRSISVSQYEVVIGQAVKNLCFLDRLNMYDGLSEGLKNQIGKLVWHDGLVSTREEMLDTIAQIGTSY